MTTEFIMVKSGRKDDKVALWEQHPDHPNGEVWVAGANAKPVKVAKTGAVHRKLSDGELVEVSTGKK